MGFHLKSKFASERLLTMMSIFISGFMLTGKLPSTLMHIVIIPNWNANQKIQQILTITGQLQLPQLSPRYLSRSWGRDSWGTCGQQIANLVSSKHVGQKWQFFALKQTVDIYHKCFLDAKKAFDRVNHWTLAKKLLDRNVPLHIQKLFIFWYREQEFITWCGNSLSMTFRCSNGIRQGGQLSPLLYNVYTDDLNHHL